MIKVLIADDEELFREGLALDFDWKENNMELIGLAENGIEALEMVNIHTPDIVVTDIRMPFLDGLEFIEKARKINPETQFIIISGHDEFEYAQKAVRLGVCDFLLKPLEDGEFEKLLLERKVQILKNRKLSRERSIRNSFLRLKKQMTSDKNDFYRIIIIQFDDYSSLEGTPPEFYSEIGKTVSKLPETTLIESRNGSAIYSINGPKISLLNQKLSSLIMTLRTNEGLKSNFSFTVGIGSASEGIEKLNTSFEEAKSAINQKFLEGKNSTFYFDKIHAADSPDLLFQNGELDYSDLLHSIRTGESAAMEACLAKLIRTTALMGKDSFAYGLMIVGNVFTEALKMLDDSGVNSTELMGNPMTVYERITSHQTMEEMFQEFRLNLLLILNHLALKSSGGNELLFEKIKAFINKNFKNPDLGLQLAADNFNISQGYLCSIFSRCSKETFKEYLTRVRINRARDLIISSDYMVYEIAQKVGYNNPTYFNSVFKKTTGFSPGQYKKVRNSQNIK